MSQQRVFHFLALAILLASCLQGGDANQSLSQQLDIPIISSVTTNSGTLTLNDNLDFTVQFSHTITVTGSPAIGIIVGSTQKYAVYQSGSGTNTLVFRYTVGSGDSDSDGLDSDSSILLSGGTLLSASGSAANRNFTAPDLSAVVIDGIAPSVSSITPPSNGNYTSSTTTDLDFTLVFDDTVTVAGGTPQLTLTIGSNSRNATYVSGTGTTSLLFRYSVVAADMDMDGIALGATIDLNGATIKDDNGNDASLSLTAPTMNLVTVTFPGIEMWLDVNEPSTVLDAEGDAADSGAFGNIVATWSDRSGLGNHATQTTGGIEPDYVPNAVNTNMPVVRFNGTTDFMSTTYDANTDTVIFTVFAHDMTGAGNPTGPLWQTQADVGTSGFFPAYSNGNQYVASSGWVTKASTFTRNQFYYTTVIADTGANTTELYDGGTLNHSGGGTQPAGNNFQIAKRTTNIYRGDIVEIIIFNRVLTKTVNGEIDQIEAYLANKWGL